MVKIFIIAYESKKDNNRATDFMDMFLHHLVTVTLYGFCFMTNFVKVGASTVLMNDVGEVPLLMARMGANTIYRAITGVCLITLCIVWIYTRIYGMGVLLYIWSIGIELNC